MSPLPLTQQIQKPRWRNKLLLEVGSKINFSLGLQRRKQPCKKPLPKEWGAHLTNKQPAITSSLLWHLARGFTFPTLATACPTGQEGCKGHLLSFRCLVLRCTFLVLRRSTWADCGSWYLSPAINEVSPQGNYLLVRWEYA